MKSSLYINQQIADAAANPQSGVQRRRLLKWGFVVGFWLFFGLLNASQTYLGFRMENFPIPFWPMFSWQMLGWGSWAFLTPLVLWLGRRFPLERASLVRGLLVHIPACVLVSAAHIAFFTYLTIHLSPFGAEGHPRSFGEMFAGRMTSQFHIDLLIYAATLGTSYAVSYYERYREREVRATQLEAQLAQAQLQALKMQLHPHFLFNTLNGIAGLVRDQKNKAAVDMLVGLSDLLRYTLENAGKQEVPLREELDFLELYLDIQKMRFPDRLQVEMRVASNTLDALVPNLILQPLVENAIRHGVSLRADRGMIRITAERADGVLQIVVHDDGPGLRRGTPQGTGDGIGLSNTRARLAQLYGEGHRFTAANRASGGFEAALAIPFKLEAAGG
ncbi:MAG TPA: histidine kinase [Pyrinomonadaceae bacterium]|nr:histidine kinase [Pyrinomonadaceae bacterium]